MHFSHHQNTPSCGLKRIHVELIQASAFRVNFAARSGSSLTSLQRLWKRSPDFVTLPQLQLASGNSKYAKLRRAIIVTTSLDLDKSFHVDSLQRNPQKGAGIFKHRNNKLKIPSLLPSDPGINKRTLFVADGVLRRIHRAKLKAAAN